MAVRHPSHGRPMVLGALLGALAAVAIAGPALAQDGGPETVILQSPPAHTTAHTITYTFVSDAADATFRCSLDYAPSAPCTSPMTYTDLPDGAHTVLVTAVGPDGRADDSPAVAHVVVDSLVPDTIITSVQPARTNATIAAIEFASSERGTATCALDGRPLNPCASPVPLTGLAPGPHTFAVTAIDLTGNVDPTPATTTWTVDPVRWLGPARVRADRRWHIALRLGPLDQPARVRVKGARGVRRATTARTVEARSGVTTPTTIVLDLATRRVLAARGRLTVTVSAWIGELAARATRRITVLAPPRRR